MNRREFDTFGVVRSGLKAIDRIGLFERIQGQLAQMVLEHVDAAASRAHALQCRWFQMALDVRVEKTRDVSCNLSVWAFRVIGFLQTKQVDRERRGVAQRRARGCSRHAGLPTRDPATSRYQRSRTCPTGRLPARGCCLDDGCRALSAIRVSSRSITARLLESMDWPAAKSYGAIDRANRSRSGPRASHADGGMRWKRSAHPAGIAEGVATSRHERDHGENDDSVAIAVKRTLLSRFVSKEATLDSTRGEYVSEPQLEWPQAVSGGLLLAASEASRDQRCWDESGRPLDVTERLAHSLHAGRAHESPR
jgi:hypothetical protein